MVAIEDKPVFKAGGLEELTYEFFSGVIQSAYSTALVLEDLIVN